jgi:hypothetical protein
MTDRDRAGMRALCDQFRTLIERQIERQLFEDDARQRLGEVISSAVRHGGPAFSYLSRKV